MRKSAAMEDRLDGVREVGLRWLLPYERRLVARNVARWKSRLEEANSATDDLNRRKLLNLSYAWLSGPWGIAATVLTFAAILIQSVGAGAIIGFAIPAGIAWSMFILRLTQAFTAYPHNVRFP
jgi:hypothetical protein